MTPLQDLVIPRLEIIRVVLLKILALLVIRLPFRMDGVGPCDCFTSRQMIMTTTAMFVLLPKDLHRTCTTTWGRRPKNAMQFCMTLTNR